MSYTYISSAYASGSPSNKDEVKQAAGDLASYLDGQFSHNFYSYDYGNIGISAGGYSDNDSGEESFIRDVIEYLVDNTYFEPGEQVAIAHKKFLWGYGMSIDHQYNGDTYYGCTVYADSAVSDWEAQGFTWHELAHGLMDVNGSNAHGQGSYSLSGNDMYNITPMAMSYLYNQDMEVDTLYEGGSGGIPDTWENGEDNYNYYYLYGRSSDADREANHDITKLSPYTLSEIQDWLDNNYP